MEQSFVRKAKEKLLFKRELKIANASVMLHGLAAMRHADFPILLNLFGRNQLMFSRAFGTEYSSAGDPQR